MKKTSRTFKRFAAITSASLLAACMVAPMAGSAAEVTEGTGNTITVTTKDDAVHKYEAYQVFSGSFSGGTLNNIQWGDGVNGPAILTALKGDQTIIDEENDTTLGSLFASCEDADDVAGVLSNFSFNDASMKAFVKIVGANKTDVKSGEVNADGNVISKLPDGYYLIQDSQAPTSSDGGENSGAKTSYIVKVTDNASVNVDAKHAAPTVDKLVLDEAGDKDTDSTDTAGWGETADHEINESFQFKLVAEIPENDNLVDYNSYKVVFNDTMSNGVTFDGIASVYVGTNQVKAYDAETNPDGYKLTGIEINDAGGTFALEIADILKYDSDLTDADTTITVIYNAHLNENADVSTVTGNIVNKNTVSLQYSNNPNWNGSGTEELGTTKEDSVWVATYKITNIKKDGESGDVLPGVKFELKDSDGNAIQFKYDETDKVYYRDDTGSTELVSNAEGKFDLVGLDYGEYTLVETAPLPGYNDCSDTEIVLKATHVEASDGTSATVTMSSENKGISNIIENFTGTQLPGTGGIGTTIFYLGGGAMVAVAGIYLISKKRMKNTQE